MNIFHEILSGATRYPERLSIVEHEQDYTYRQLLDAASQVAKKISEMPISQRPIIVFGKNGFLSLAALLGVSLTGRAYIPVDAHTPFERTQLIMQAANPSLVIHTVELEEHFSQLLDQEYLIQNTKKILVLIFHKLIVVKLLPEMISTTLSILRAQRGFQKV